MTSIFCKRYSRLRHLLLGSLLCSSFSASLFAATAPASAAAPSGTATVERAAAGDLPMDDLLRQQLPADTSVMTLEVGQQKFHALMQQPDRPDALGGILLLPDPDSGPDWARQSQALLIGLARRGWLTLALQPPTPDEVKLPERTLPVLQPVAASGAAPSVPATPASNAASTAKPANANTPPPPPFAQRLQERLDQAIQELGNQKVPRLVLLAFGRAAPWAAEYAVKHPQQKIQLVLLDALPDSNDKAPALSKLWQGLVDTHVIDVYHLTLPYYPSAAPDARMRREQARRQRMKLFHQVILPQSFDGWQPDMPWLVASINGALKSQILEPAQKQAPKPPPLVQTAPGSAP